MDTKLHIDIQNGVLKVQGSETFILHIYKEFMDKVSEKLFIQDIQKEQAQVPAVIPHKDQSKLNLVTTNTSTAPLKAKTATRRTIRPSNNSIVKDLDLSAHDGKPSLRDFYSRYHPKNQKDRNLIFAYYLQTIAGVSPITQDHIFTCYREIADMGVVTPNVYQSLKDTSSRNGWIDSTSTTDIKLTRVGINYLEHKMPKADTKVE